MARYNRPDKKTARIKALLYGTLSVAMVWAASRAWGPVPPLGAFLSPFTGFMQLAEPYKKPEPLQIPQQYVRGKLSVELDSLQIPHIEASNNYDLYFAQGYVTARHRLWQMEFQTHAAAGRLSELVGPKALEYDRFQRRFGMVWAAENTLKVAMQDSLSALALTAYSDGVNAWISNLPEKKHPLEYRLLNYAPEAWTPLKTALLLKYMAYTLSTNNDDFALSNIRRHFGDSVIAELFPNYPQAPDPIIPRKTAWNFQALPIPAVPSEIAKFQAPNPKFQPHPDNGSNNWAVSGKLTQSGYPLLANDPHLNLSLPSLWYQVYLKGPNQDCAGVSLPGAPGIIIGFSDSVAWGVTNTGADVLDYYSIQLRNAAAREFWFNGAWTKLSLRPETIKVKNSETVYDTVRYTPHGPIVYMANEKAFKPEVPVAHAARWLAHDGSNELKTFLKLNRANNYPDFLSALEGYSSPAQNFAYADAAGNIAQWCQGKFPLRWPGQGKYTLDGANPDYNWKQYIPQSQNPHVLNPERGFISSANQVPTDSSYPYYLDWNFAAGERSRRINNKLRSYASQSVLNADSFRLMQTDSYSLHAAKALPIMLSMLDSTRFTQDEKMAFRWLKLWDYRYTASALAPGVFEAWWSNFYQSLWQPHFGHSDYTFPNREITLQLLSNSGLGRALKWAKTPDGEQHTYPDLVRASFTFAVNSLPKPRLSKNPALQWANIKSTSIQHLARLAPLSRNKLFVGGAKTTINALSAGHGPSWRMVVQMGKTKATGYGIYPGGQDGNPGSYFYDNLLKKWQNGELNVIK